MSEPTKKCLVLALRFPEFRDADAWVNKRLYEVVDVNASGDLDSENFSPTKTEEHIYPIYSNSVTQEGLYGYCTYPKYQKDSVTITARGTLGVAFYRDHDYVGIGRLLILSNLKNVVPYFLQEIWNYSVKIPLENGGIPQLTAIKARAIELWIPKKEEQQKIADCLTSIDELVTAQTQKIEALKAHKKGLMQQLFPAEGETAPKLRFPEFRDAGEWKQKKLSAVAALTSSKRVHLSDYVPSGIPFFRGKEISLLRNSRIPDDLLYISQEHYDEIKEKYGVPQIGDILITAVGTLGNVYCVRNSNKFYFKDGNLIWMKNISENPIFLEILLNVKSEDVLSSAIGSSQKALTMVELNKLEFRFPKKEEQQKIADCLSSIDELITAQTQKIEALKAHKKGLMQQLFPDVDLASA
jgi:restriction endonuclease S subunit